MQILQGIPVSSCYLSVLTACLQFNTLPEAEWEEQAEGNKARERGCLIFATGDKNWYITGINQATAAHYAYDACSRQAIY